MFRASFHTIVTSRASWYAPPDMGGIKFDTSCRRTTAINRRCSLDLPGCTFLRGGFACMRETAEGVKNYFQRPEKNDTMGER